MVGITTKHTLPDIPINWEIQYVLVLVNETRLCTFNIRYFHRLLAHILLIYISF